MRFLGIRIRYIAAIWCRKSCHEFWEAVGSFEKQQIFGKDQDMRIPRRYVGKPCLFIAELNSSLWGRFRICIYQEDITLNIELEVDISECLPGHAWGNVVHNQNGSWISHWLHPILSYNMYTQIPRLPWKRKRANRARILSKFYEERSLRNNLQVSVKIVRKIRNQAMGNSAYWVLSCTLLTIFLWFQGC